MQYLGIEYQIRNLPALDRAFIPFGVWASAYEKGADRPFKIAVERENGLVTVYETKLRGAEFAEALNIAISGLLAPGDHVLSTDLEHNSVLRPLYREMERGVSVSFLPADRKGCIDYADFDRLLQTNTKAVICTAGSNLTGNLLDLTRIGAFCAAHGLLFVVDASQTAGVFPIDLRAQHISVLCFTGHKSLMGRPCPAGP